MSGATEKRRRGIAQARLDSCRLTVFMTLKLDKRSDISTNWPKEFRWSEKGIAEQAIGIDDALLSKFVLGIYQ